MTDTPQTWLARYRPWKRTAEVGFWVAVLLIQMLFNAITTWMDLRSFPFWQPLVWELTSNLVVGLLVPAIVAFERRFPLRWDTLPRNLAWHLAGTLGFCTLHLAGMLGLRSAVYAALGMTYEHAGWLAAFGYEYLKDVRSYAMILAAIVSYRLLLLRMQGEARELDAPEPPAGQPAAPPAPPARPERFLVRKLRKEFLIQAADIDWLQAQGNYVGLRVHGHDYLLRSTLADFLDKLDPAKFVRVHRSHAVNLDRIAEIEPTDGGDAKLRMKDGSTVPCSRRYREALGRTA